jgi:hypothetical protein
MLAPASCLGSTLTRTKVATSMNGRMWQVTRLGIERPIAAKQDTPDGDHAQNAASASEA